jgi:hypothetical protein
MHFGGDGSDGRVTMMKKLIVACVMATGGVTGVAAAAGASTPVVQACVGSTFSEAALTLHDADAPPGFLGQVVVSGFAQQPDAQAGLGDGIQALQAGLTPDSVAVNTCNG